MVEKILSIYYFAATTKKLLLPKNISFALIWVVAATFVEDILLVTQVNGVEELQKGSTSPIASLSITIINGICALKTALDSTQGFSVKLN